MLVEIEKKIPIEEFDYVMLKDALKEYKNPRVKINDLLKRNAIVRIKKGLYILGEQLAAHPYSKETLANLIYGPSYISLEYALSFYGFIPEKTETITSITNKRNKQFQTPVGLFTYKFIRPALFSFGLTQQQLDEHHFILIASPEKAIADFLHFSHCLNNLEELDFFLFHDMRFDRNRLINLHAQRLKKLGKMYGGNVQLFYSFWEELDE
ncbi:MAG TPA: hypothetical protein PLD62_06475 [Candidatus Cloacimonadota bacterium]|nr:hypothetical protein [Candidatus Cloacimonadota bacterium]